MALRPRLATGLPLSGRVFPLYPAICTRWARRSRPSQSAEKTDVFHSGRTRAGPTRLTYLSHLDHSGPADLPLNEALDTAALGAPRPKLRAEVDLIRKSGRGSRLEPLPFFFACSKGLPRALTFTITANVTTTMTFDNPVQPASSPERIRPGTSTLRRASGPRARSRSRRARGRR